MMPRSIEWVCRAVTGRLVGGHDVSSVCIDQVRTDSRRVTERDLYVALRGARLDGHDFVQEAFQRGASAALVERVPEGVRGLFVVVPDTGKALIDLAAGQRREFEGTVIGVTGSCGKTTTKDFLRHLLSARLRTVASPSSFNNAIGVPLTLLDVEPETEVAVVEIGTNAPGEIRALTELVRPRIGIVTNVFASHLEGLGSVDGVANEKADLLRSLPEDGLAVINADCPRSRFLREQTRARVVMVGLDEEADYRAEDRTFHLLGTSFTFRGKRITVPAIGTHFAHNVLIAIAVADHLGVRLEDLLERFATLPQTPHRLERKCFGDVTVLDDTYNANPGSMNAAIQAVAGLPPNGYRRKVAILGDMLELGSASEALHRQIGERLAERAQDFALLHTVGSRSRHLAEPARLAGIPGKHYDSTRELTEDLLTWIEPKDLILVKGSNALGMERVVHAIATLHPKQEEAS